MLPPSMFWITQDGSILDLSTSYPQIPDLIKSFYPGIARLIAFVWMVYIRKREILSGGLFVFPFLFAFHGVAGRFHFFGDRETVAASSSLSRLESPEAPLPPPEDPFFPSSPSSGFSHRYGSMPPDRELTPPPQAD